MIIAQALGEYVGLSVVISAFRETWWSMRDYLTRVDSSTWMMVALAVAVLSIIWARSR